MKIEKFVFSDSEMKFSNYDVFISCSSFENRCRVIAEKIDSKNIKQALICENKNLIEYVGKNGDYIRHLFKGKVIDVALDTQDPVLSSDNLISALISLNVHSGIKVLVDISTFTHEHLIILTKLLFEYKETWDITFVYLGADYCPKTERIEDIWLSKGVKEVRSILGFPGEIIPSRKTYLIILVGYEYERALKLIESFEPDKILLGYGKKGSETSQKERGANSYFQKLVKRMTTTHEDTGEFEFPCNDPYATAIQLNEILVKEKDFNIVIAPLNTKLSSIGCALVAMRNDTIQLCYAQALQYNYNNYSEAKDYCYMLEYKSLFL